MDSKGKIAIENLLRPKHSSADGHMSVAEKQILDGLQAEFLEEVGGLTDEFGGSKDRLAGEIEKATEAFLNAVGNSLEESNSVEEKVKDHYRGKAGALYHQGKRGISEKAYPWVAKVRNEKIGPLVRPRDVVLEFGVGSGWNLSQLKCRRKIGFDVSENLEQVVTSHGIEFITDIDTVDGTTIDVVVCHHVLEHTVNPTKVLGQIMKKLRPGGRLLLFVPYEKEKCYHHFNRNEPNHHLYSWNVQTLSNLVEECGFEVAQAHLGKYGYARFASAWAERLGLGERGFRMIRALVSFTRPLLEVRIICKSPHNNNTEIF
jgi:SAM-dependent methyltransferase